MVQLKNWLLVASGLTTATARFATNANVTRFDCGVGTKSADESFLSAISQLSSTSNQTSTASSPRSLSQLARFFTRQTTTGSSAKTIAVTTWFHVISSKNCTAAVSPKMISAQIAALNAAYSPYGITFNLQGTTNTTNDDWAAASSASAMSKLKSSLRKGTYSTLNVYFHSDLGGGILGTCTLPTAIGTSTPKNAYAFDGCNVAAQSMPGGNIYGYNEGKTAVHEVGHWLGLLHVFEGYSCTGDGDYIGDTPAQSTATDGCPVAPSKDSCKAVPGVDSVHNYMDYSTDACYERFTTGQVQRIKSLWTRFRAGR